MTEGWPEWKSRRVACPAATTEHSGFSFHRTGRCNGGGFQPARALACPNRRPPQFLLPASRACRCCRCGTWWCIRTWSSRCSWGGKNPSRRSMPPCGPTSASCSSPRRRPTSTIPRRDDLYRIGTVATILQLLKLPDGTVKVLVEGVDRARIDRLHGGEYYSADAELLPDTEAYDERELDVLGRSVIIAVRAVREAQQEGAARGADRARRHRESRPPRRHRRRAHVAQARREAEGSRDPRHAQAPRAHPRRHRRRDGRAADREAHPRPRQGADGEEPARVLPE